MKQRIPAAEARVAVVVACLLSATSAFAAPSAAERCQAGKNDVAGRYSACRQKAEKGFVVRGDATKRDLQLEKCDDKYADSWTKLEDAAVRAGSACRTVGDASKIADFLVVVGAGLSQALDGGSLPPTSQPLKTGQTVCLLDGYEVPCAGTGQDGETQYGAARAFTDNGDGTITDETTGLVWEKLSDDGLIHDKDATSTWSAALAGKIATLNATSFAGHTDWRMPTRFELETLINLGTIDPAVHAPFDSECLGGCDGVSCSCTPLGGTWTTTSVAEPPPASGSYWTVDFEYGTVETLSRLTPAVVRAVRGGSN